MPQEKGMGWGTHRTSRIATISEKRNVVELINGFLAQTKCDGKDPCHYCSARGRECEYPSANDNAHVSRQ